MGRIWCIPKLWVAYREEAQINCSRGLDGESEDLRPGRLRSFTHNFGMHGKAWCASRSGVFLTPAGPVAATGAKVWSVGGNETDGWARAAAGDAAAIPAVPPSLLGGNSPWMHGRSLLGTTRRGRDDRVIARPFRIGMPAAGFHPVNPDDHGERSVCANDDWHRFRSCLFELPDRCAVVMREISKRGR